jgi:hypothetical protein
MLRKVLNNNILLQVDLQQKSPTTSIKINLLQLKSHVCGDGKMINQHFFATN